MPNKITSELFLSPYKKKSKNIKFPLENVKRIAIRPSENEGETFYALPLVEALAKKFKLTVLLPNNKDPKYFRRLHTGIIHYNQKSGPIGIFRLKNSIKQQYDLLIDLNKENIHVFSYVLKKPVVASIYDAPGVNITVRAKTKSIINSYQFLIKLLGFPYAKWETKAVKPKKTSKKSGNEVVVGITSDISTPYHGLQQVKEVEDLNKISQLISKKNDLSTFAFFLKIPQVLLLEERDSFQPPDSIKVIRYSRKITPKIIGDCLIL